MSVDPLIFIRHACHDCETAYLVRKVTELTTSECRLSAGPDPLQDSSSSSLRIVQS